MSLTLRVTSYTNLPPQRELIFPADLAECTIGRSPDNTFVLPDPERVVSQRHAIITYEEDVYYLLDNSTNGTYINHANDPVGQGNRHQLCDGDLLAIGGYECQVSISDNKTTNPSLIAAAAPELSTELIENETILPIKPEGQGKSGRPTVEIFEGANVSKYQAESQNFLGQYPNTRAVIPTDYDFPFHGKAESPTASATHSDHTPSDQQHYRLPEAIPEDWDSVTGWRPPKQAAASAAIPETRKTVRASPGSNSSTSAGHHVTPRVSPLANKSASKDKQAVTAFCAGAGLPTAEVNPNAIPTFMALAGRLLREMTKGFKQVLDTRTSLKGAFRVEVTTIRPVKNNPLKFSVDVDDALSRLLFPPAKGYLPPIEAVHEATDDLQAHQMAILAGLRAALKALLARFDPAALESTFQERSILDNLLPIARKARCWELLREIYKQVAADAENDFLHLLGQEFARAYQRQVATLGTARLKSSQPNKT